MKDLMMPGRGGWPTAVGSRAWQDAWPEANRQDQRQLEQLENPAVAISHQRFLAHRVGRPNSCLAALAAIHG